MGVHRSFSDKYFSEKATPARQHRLILVIPCILLISCIGLFWFFVIYEPDPARSLDIFCANLIAARYPQAYMQLTNYAQSRYPEAIFTRFFVSNPVKACSHINVDGHSGAKAAILSLITASLGKLVFNLSLRTESIGSVQDGFIDRWKIEEMCTSPPRKDAICIQ